MNKQVKLFYLSVNSRRVKGVQLHRTLQDFLIAATKLKLLESFDQLNVTTQVHRARG